MKTPRPLLFGLRKVRERRNASRRAGRAGRAASIVASLGFRVWARAARRPVDTLAILGAAAASLLIVVNAVFLQSRPSPTPFVANPALPQASENPANPSGKTGGKLAEALTRAAAGLRTSQPGTLQPGTSQPVLARRNDPIADLIGSSIGTPTRVIAVQRVLAAFGYGQIKPSGFVDEPTSTAIEKFETEHKLPVTGRLSDRLLRELAVMTGRPVE